MCKFVYEIDRERWVLAFIVLSIKHPCSDGQCYIKPLFAITLGTALCHQSYSMYSQGTHTSLYRYPNLRTALGNIDKWTFPIWFRCLTMEIYCLLSYCTGLE